VGSTENGNQTSSISIISASNGDKSYPDKLTNTSTTTKVSPQTPQTLAVPGANTMHTVHILKKLARKKGAGPSRENGTASTLSFESDDDSKLNSQQKEGDSDDENENQERGGGGKGGERGGGGGAKRKAGNSSSDDQPRSFSSKEMRAFVTLSYVVVSYMLCWVPFHFIFDISAVDPTLVPEVAYTICFWLTYLNSTINPILYNFSSKDFRRAFKDMICRQ
jgi:hypothetical protein